MTARSNAVSLVRRIVFPWILFLAMVSGIGEGRRVFAKDCNCLQHSAFASGSGSCSLAEDASRCDISYTGSSRTQEHQDAVAVVAQEFGVEFDPRETFLLLNDRQPSFFQGVFFQSLIVNILAILDIDSARDRIRMLGIEENWGTDLPETLREAQDMFMHNGCFDLRQDDLRVMVISRFSRFDAQCTDLW